MQTMCCLISNVSVLSLWGIDKVLLNLIKAYCDNCQRDVSVTNDEGQKIRRKD